MMINGLVMLVLAMVAFIVASEFVKYIFKNLLVAGIVFFVAYNLVVNYNILDMIH